MAHMIRSVLRWSLTWNAVQSSWKVSQMFSKNVETLLKELVAEGELSLDFEDEIVAGTCVTHGGEVRHGPTKEKLG